MEGKTKPTSFRIPADLYARLQEIKHTQAHPKINDSEFLVEAVRLYVTLAETFGLDNDLMVQETIGKYHPHQKEAEKKKQMAGLKVTTHHDAQSLKKGHSR